MPFLVKLALTAIIIGICTFLGKRFPSIAGLIAVMPLTGVIVLMWLHSENKSNNALMISYTKGALIGIIPTILFYIAAYICFLRRLPLSAVLLISFGVWMAGAIIHQLFLK